MSAHVIFYSCEIYKKKEKQQNLKYRFPEVLISWNVLFSFWLRF